MIVSSPEGDMHERHVCPKVNILITDLKVFHLSLGLNLNI
jgi:hypothetical protein